MVYRLIKRLLAVFCHLKEVAGKETESGVFGRKAAGSWLVSLTISTPGRSAQTRMAMRSAHDFFTEL